MCLYVGRKKKQTDKFFIYFFYVYIFFYLTETNTARKGTQAGGGEGEAGSPLSREPDARLDPRTLGS